MTGKIENRESKSKRTTFISTQIFIKKKLVYTLESRHYKQEISTILSVSAT